VRRSLASRSLESPSFESTSLESTRFDLVLRTFEVLSLGMPSGVWMVFPLLGLSGLVFFEKRKLSWLLAGTLAYLWLATILVQPPNARYRVPGLAWEILFTVAGFWFAARAAIWLFRKSLAVLSRSQAHAAAEPRLGISTTSAPWVAAGVLCVILGVRAWAARDLQPLLGTEDFAARESQEAPGGPPSSPPQLLREISAAGRALPVLYWEGAAMERDAVASAEVAVAGGGSYLARVFYSCEAAACAGATLELIALDSEGRAVGRTSSPLSQERIDNDLFWDQLELRIDAPNAVRRIRAELHLQPGMGNLVAPLIFVQRKAPLS
jgi:hypothetical protein